jgi:(4S)-4-hydroxy-5-phosphonooxypentane-2,3-dione isomerase
MVSLVVHFTIKPGMEARAKEFIRTMEEHSRREPGCRQYIGLQLVDDPREFCFYEQYDDQAALEAHRDSAHFQKYVVGGLDEILEKRTRQLYNVVNP